MSWRNVASNCRGFESTIYQFMFVTGDLKDPTNRTFAGGVAMNIENKRNRKIDNMDRVTHFEIYTDHPEAVQPFYRDVFGWKFQKFEGGPIEYWLVTTGDDKHPGINGGMTRPRKGQRPGTLDTVAVKSLDQTIKKIEQRGGKICLPKMVIPKIGWLAYAEDPAGNVFGIIEPNTDAK
jgi:hypothetical protein